MSDVCLNTKRFNHAVDFSGASENDLRRIAAAVLIYAGEVAPSHVGATDDATTANILRNLREDDEAIQDDLCDSSFRFNYCDEEWTVMDEDYCQQYREDTIENLMETIEDEVEQAVINLGALGSYVTIDKDMLVRDMDYMGEIEMAMATHDGVLHELYFTEYTSGDGSLVTKRCNIYAYRSD